jgi:hypothetical protein
MGFAGTVPVSKKILKLIRGHNSEITTVASR